jgi:EF-P beta-lysylation protein EpmB
MIPVSAVGLEPKQIKAVEINDLSWQKQLAMAFKSIHELLAYLSIDPKDVSLPIDGDAGFAVKVPHAFADLMQPGNANDPLLKQVLPLACEAKPEENYSKDPLNESEYSPTPGLIHKYQNRVLLIAHQSCAVHCRYCFRRHFPYDQQQLRTPELQQALTYIENRSDITEVILSGGDPLSLSDDKFSQLIDKLDQLTSITTIRIHSRTPVVLPDRLTPVLLKRLARSTKRIVFVLHINHSQEISHQLAARVQLMRTTGITVLNQTVLLKGINDKVETLEALSNKLWLTGIMPYYLHALDPVQGAAHFNVDEKSSIALWSALQARVSGYLLPRLVREIPEKPSKTWINGL